MNELAIVAAIEKAVKELQAGEWFPAYTFKLEENWDELGLGTSEERLQALIDVTAEIRPTDWDSPPPPGTANEPVCRGSAIYQFVWDSERFGRRMFYRFALGRVDGKLWVFSLHPARYPQKPKQQSRRRQRRGR